MPPYPQKRVRSRRRRPHPLGKGPLKKAPARIVVAIALLVSVAWIFERCATLPN